MLTFKPCLYTETELATQIARYAGHAARYADKLNARNWGPQDRRNIEADLAEALDSKEDFEKQLAFYYTNKR
jgi:hypothetical protein